MKAILFHDHGGPEVLEYADFPTPEPGPGEVLVRANGSLVHHSTRAYGNNDGEGWPKTGENWLTVFEAHPLEIVLEAEFKTVTPWIGPLRLQVRQRDFRRGVSSGVPLSAG